MPAKFDKSYQSPSGKVFPTLADAQTDDLVLMLSAEGAVTSTDVADSVAKFLVANASQVAACLKQKERVNLSTPKAPRKKKQNAATAA